MKLCYLTGAGLIIIGAFAAGCAKPPTLEEIQAEQRNLPGLYLTEESLTPIEAPAAAGMFVDEKTGEIAYPAYECLNPDCPGRAADGKPFLFIHRDVLVSADGSGNFTWSQIPPGKSPEEYIKSLGGHMSPTCPKCLEGRDLANESQAEKQQYDQWVKQHEMPATAIRRAELEAEYEKAFAAREAIRRGE